MDNLTIDKQGEKLELDRISAAPPKKADKDAAKQELEALGEELFDLQDLLWGAKQHSVLIVLQGRDTAGKDGTIKHVAGYLNPRGVSVTSFGVPSEEEREHDFLWRIHRHAPRKGELSIFNRSHYEDVLVVRVKELVEEERWRSRYDSINDFERMLVREGTTVLKFFLHISKDTQLERFRERLEREDKHYKFSSNDVRERRHWDDYQRAYRDMLALTSTPWAPWYVVPADRKWFRNYVVARTVAGTLDALDPEWPEPEEDLERFAAGELGQLESERSSR